MPLQEPVAGPEGGEKGGDFHEAVRTRKKFALNEHNGF